MCGNVYRRHVNLLCLNIPGMVMSLGQPSNRKKAAQLVQVSIYMLTCMGLYAMLIYFEGAC